MNIYLVEIKDQRKLYMDFYSGHVIAANSPITARKMAAQIAADEGEEVWKSITLTDVELLAKNVSRSKEEIILSNFYGT